MRGGSNVNENYIELQTGRIAVNLKCVGHSDYEICGVPQIKSGQQMLFSMFVGKHYENIIRFIFSTFK